MEDVDSGEDSAVRAESSASDSMICYSSLDRASGDSIDDCICSIYERGFGCGEGHCGCFVTSVRGSVQVIRSQLHADHSVECSKLYRYFEFKES